MLVKIYKYFYTCDAKFGEGEFAYKVSNRIAVLSFHVNVRVYENRSSVSPFFRNLNYNVSFNHRSAIINEIFYL
jgi:hypothetical protein